MSATIPSPSDLTAKWVGFEWEQYLNANQETTAAAVIGRLIVRRKSRLRGFSIAVATPAGTSGNTTVRVDQNGSAVTGSSLSVAFNAAANTQATTSLDVAVSPGDVIAIEVTAVTAGTASSGLAALATLVRDYS